MLHLLGAGGHRNALQLVMFEPPLGVAAWRRGGRPRVRQLVGLHRGLPAPPHSRARHLALHGHTHQGLVHGHLLHDHRPRTRSAACGRPPLDRLLGNVGLPSSTVQLVLQLDRLPGKVLDVFDVDPAHELQQVLARAAHRELPHVGAQHRRHLRRRLDPLGVRLEARAASANPVSELQLDHLLLVAGARDARHLGGALDRLEAHAALHRRHLQRREGGDGRKLVAVLQPLQVRALAQRLPPRPRTRPPLPQRKTRQSSRPRRCTSTPRAPPARGGR
mmetsp:Transcript_95627/g.259559  ORF Transcript_95627/g.259559 Transcript_95627/m.259559 type:complete len:276 (+) Transcript_95627:632-1459(+)